MMLLAMDRAASVRSYDADGRLCVTSNIVRITCTGEAAKTINWEVSYEWR